MHITHRPMPKLHKEVRCRLLFYHSIICERGEINAASKIKLKYYKRKKKGPLAEKNKRSKFQYKCKLL